MRGVYASRRNIVVRIVERLHARRLRQNHICREDDGMPLRDTKLGFPTCSMTSYSTGGRSIWQQERGPEACGCCRSSVLVSFACPRTDNPLSLPLPPKSGSLFIRL